MKASPIAVPRRCREPKATAAGALVRSADRKVATESFKLNDDAIELMEARPRGPIGGLQTLLLPRGAEEALCGVSARPLQSVDVETNRLRLPSNERYRCRQDFCYAAGRWGFLRSHSA
jgi:hypothetical protein